MKNLLLILLLLSSQAFALKEYYSLSRSIRSLGMGGANYGLSDDEYALFYNPAGLSLYRGDGSFLWGFNSAISHGGTTNVHRLRTALDSDTEDVGALLNSIGDLQGDPIYLNLNSMPFYLRRHFAVALLLADTKASVSLLGKEFDSSVDATIVSDSGLILGYGRSVFHPRLHLGINAKVLFRAGGRKEFTLVDIAQNGTTNLTLESLGGIGTGFDFDLGAIYELPKIKSLPTLVASRLGLTLSNIIATDFPGNRTGTPPALPRKLSLGSLFVTKGIGVIDNFIVAFDFAEIGIGGQGDIHLGSRGGSFWKHVNIGLETPIRGWLRPRIGLHQGSIGAGFSIDFRVGKFDFAWYEEQIASGVGRLSSRRYAFRLALGYSPPDPGPMGAVPVSQEGPRHFGEGKLKKKGKKKKKKEDVFPARDRVEPQNEVPKKDVLKKGIPEKIDVPKEKSAEPKKTKKKIKKKKKTTSDTQGKVEKPKDAKPVVKEQ